MPNRVPAPANDTEVALQRFLTKAGAPVDGASGDGAGFAPKGKLLIDYTNGELFINTGTMALPVWTLVGAQV